MGRKRVRAHPVVHREGARVHVFETQAQEMVGTKGRRRRFFKMREQNLFVELRTETRKGGGRKVFDQGVWRRAETFSKVGRAPKKRVQYRQRLACDRAQVGPGLPLEAGDGKAETLGDRHRKRLRKRGFLAHGFGVDPFDQTLKIPKTRRSVKGAHEK